MKQKSFYSLIKKLSMVAIGCLLVFAACKPKDPDCYQSILVLNFSQFQTRYTRYDTIRVDSFSYVIDTVVGVKDSIMPFPEMLVLGEDSAYRVSGKEIALLPSPFNPANSSVRYRFTADTVNKQYDTLTFFYTPSPHFVNNNCGYTYYYNLDSVKTSGRTLDSSFVISPSLTDDNTNKTRKANVIFYFKKKP